MIRNFILFGTAVILAGCGGHPTEATRAESKKAPVPVSVEVVDTSESPSFYEAAASVRARTAAQVSSRVMAYVRDVRVKIGDQVREGQVLAVLDSRDADVRKGQAEAAHEEARSAALEAEQSYASAKANLELAETTFNRMKDLFEKTSISPQEFDEVTARVRVARASVEMAGARRSQVGAKIRQAEQEIKGAALIQGYTTLTAPFAGVVTEKSVEPGNLAVPGAPLLTIERGGGFRVEASVDESTLPRVRLGLPVEVQIDSLDRQLSGRVSEIVPSVDLGARSAVVKIDVPNVPGMRSGQFGRARFVTGSRSAMTVPASAVQARGQVQWVFVAADGTARSRIITAGERRGDRAEVLTGISNGERIIVAPPPGLVDGDRIEVRP
jgi:membrane fusion protein, multidrug efflux system